MMTCDEIKNLIERGLDGAWVQITGDGHHFQAVIVSSHFQGKSLLEKQRMVYATLTQDITTGNLHALAMKTYTPDEWNKI